MITSCYVQVGLKHVPDDQRVPGLRTRDPRVLAAAHRMLKARPSVLACDMVSADPVTFVVALEDFDLDTGLPIEITDLMGWLETGESFRLVWPDDGGVKAERLVPLDFTVTG